VTANTRYRINNPNNQTITIHWETEDDFGHQTDGIELTFSYSRALANRYDLTDQTIISQHLLEDVKEDLLLIDMIVTESAKIGDWNKIHKPN
jgi:hypothetical protein